MPFNCSQFHQRYMREFFIHTLFQQLFSTYMYVVKAAETTFVQKIFTFNVDKFDTWKKKAFPKKVRLSFVFFFRWKVFFVLCSSLTQAFEKSFKFGFLPKIFFARDTWGQFHHYFTSSLCASWFNLFSLGHGLEQCFPTFFLFTAPLHLFP